MEKHIVTGGKTPEGLGQALAFLGIRLRFNIRSELFEIGNGNNWQSMNDRNSQKLRYNIANTCVIKNGKKYDELLFSKQGFYDCRDALGADCETDPFTHYLDELPKSDITENDIQDYNTTLDHVFDDLFGIEWTPYLSCITRMMILGAVWRTYEPGYKIDEVAVIQGPQGAGKDSLVRCLLPDVRYFTDALGFNLSDKEKIEVTRGKVFVCASEMGGVTTTKDLEALKRWITATEDRVRMAYRRDADDMARRFVVVCTTNSDQPLPNDPTGNRRWACISLDSGAHVEPWLEERRERIWSEAVAMYRLGIKPNMPREMMLEQSTHNALRRRSDLQIEGALDDAVHDGVPVLMRDIALQIHLCETAGEWVRIGKEYQHRLRDALIARGWKMQRMRHDGSVRNWWIPPADDKKNEG